jgi:hypothetical protein
MLRGARRGARALRGAHSRLALQWWSRRRSGGLPARPRARVRWRRGSRSAGPLRALPLPARGFADRHRSWRSSPGRRCLRALLAGLRSSPDRHRRPPLPSPRGPSRSRPPRAPSRPAADLPARSSRRARRRFQPAPPSALQARPDRRGRWLRSARPSRSLGSSAGLPRRSPPCSPRGHARGCSSSAPSTAPGRAAAPGRDRRRGSPRWRSLRWGEGEPARCRTLRLASVSDDGERRADFPQ